MLQISYVKSKDEEKIDIKSASPEDTPLLPEIIGGLRNRYAANKKKEKNVGVYKRHALFNFLLNLIRDLFNKVFHNFP